MPPGFQSKHSSSSDTTSKNVSSASDKTVIGPTLPPGFLPPSHFDSDSDGSDITPHTSHSSEDAPGSHALGPVLPPGFRTNPENAIPEKRVLGPELPPDFARKPSSQAKQSMSAEASGPVLPPGFSDELTFVDDDDVIGPLPPSGDQQSEYSAAKEFEERALRMRDKLLNIVSY